METVEERLRTIENTLKKTQRRIVWLWVGLLVIPPIETVALAWLLSTSTRS